MKSCTVIDHPLVGHHLTLLRDKATPAAVFRHSLTQLTTLVAHRATDDLQVTTVTVQTPLGGASGSRLSQRLGLVPILRAGLGMVQPVLWMLPEAQVWHLGLYRDENTAQPVHYYSKLADGRPVDVALILDPMLATGGSACQATQVLVDWGVPIIKLLSIIAAPEGVKALAQRYPQTQVYTCMIDQRLDENKFIVPGLGDAGDRIFNTVH